MPNNKLCIYCEHFRIDTAIDDPGYSSMTPSYHRSMQIYCGKWHWEIEAESDGASQYRKKIETGLTCVDFEHFRE